MEDIRVETQGQWTRGMTVQDRRGRGEVVTGAGAGAAQEVFGEVGEKGGGEKGKGDACDHGAWLSGKGNLVRRMVRVDFGDGNGDEDMSRERERERRVRIGKEMLEMILGS